MQVMRRHHDAAVKARVALEAIKGEKTIAQIAGEYGIHPNQIRIWRNRALGFSRPEIFNRDRRGQFTSPDFAGRLESKGIRISKDGRGRVVENIFIERLWRTVKHEEVYLHAYETVDQARRRLADCFMFYNTERLHSALGYRTPREIDFGGSDHPDPPSSFELRV